MDPNFSHLKDKPILNIKRKIKFTVTRLIAMTYLKIQNIEVFKKTETSSFWFFTLDAWELLLCPKRKKLKTVTKQQLFLYSQEKGRHTADYLERQ